MSDAIALAQEITPYIASAVGAYGVAVLNRAEDAAAEATVSFGQRLLGLLTRGSGSQGVAVTDAVAALADSPDDADLQAALRLAVRRVLQESPGLIAAINELPRPPGASTRTSITALGPRSVAVQNNSGTITTGDSHRDRPTR
ncbi:hypothetical protein [Streptomyces sp. NPDC001415]